MEAELAIKTAHEAIKTADSALDLYTKVLDQLIPWKVFDEVITELEKYREDYSNESGELLGEIKTALLNAMDAYFLASQSIYEWCGLVVPLLTTYMQLFKGINAAKSTVQKTFLLKVLEDGIIKMKKSQEELSCSSTSFNDAAGKLTALNVRFENEFDGKSAFFAKKVEQLRLKTYLPVAAFGGPFGMAIAAGVLEGKLIPELKKRLNSIREFYDDLVKKVSKAYADIDETKLKLKEEIRVIGDLKTQTEETKTYVNLDDLEALRDIIIESVNTLITKCNEYRERHSNDSKN